jgi:uncharacterized membrane protein YgcG
LGGSCSACSAWRLWPCCCSSAPQRPIRSATLVSHADTEAEAEADAIALGTQWGVGREGYDDGLVVLLDLDDSRCHGQVQLYAAVGFREAYISNAERQRIFEETMLPHLRDCGIDAALLAALSDVEAAVSPANQARLAAARIVDAVAGLVVAPIVLLGFVGFMLWSWWRTGRDPHLADS